MLAVPSTLQSPTTLTLPPSVLAAAAPVNAVSTRQTPVALPAPLSDQPSDNNTGGSSQFLAQAIAQEDTDSTVALATTFERVAPAPEYNVFVSDSFVKYKPSDAGIPQLSLPFPPVPVAAAATATPAPAASEYQAYTNTQSRNQSNLFPGTVQLLVAG